MTSVSRALHKRNKPTSVSYGPSEGRKGRTNRRRNLGGQVGDGRLHQRPGEPSPVDLPVDAVESPQHPISLKDLVDQHIARPDHERLTGSGPRLEAGSIHDEAAPAGCFGAQVFMVTGEHLASGSGVLARVEVR